ncbi:MAG: DNA-directed RNA polymerase subunit alpha [Candidatus Berkelbacteria bacterium]|nr:DNA-directed RNA polymerase subunit alpha [Candidatus Berkelbacteria bacterium]
MEEITLPKIEATKEEENYGQFVIEPLYPGYGQTLGNCLRRVLLSSLEGAAISSVKIEGISHEFSAIPGVKEDVIEIILNLKKLQIKLFDETKAAMTLNVRGPAKITAKDIKIPSQIEIINKKQYIATIEDKKTNLLVEIVVEKGRGYLPSEAKPEKAEIGIIQTDSLFSPVVWVNFNVENTRVGQRTDFNKLILEIKTNGTMSSKEALKKSSEILVDQFKLLASLEAKPESKKTKKISSENKETKIRKIKIGKKVKFEKKKVVKNEKKATAKKRIKKSTA